MCGVDAASGCGLGHVFSGNGWVCGVVRPVCVYSLFVSLTKWPHKSIGATCVIFTNTDSSSPGQLDRINSQLTDV